jgi:hypothetical protein
VLLPGHEHAEALARLRAALHDTFGIDHMTIQIDPAGEEKCSSSF